MDLSKLPKLSNTGATQPPPQTEIPTAKPQNQPPDYARPPEDRGNTMAIVWFNVIVGLLLIYLGRTFLSYLLARAGGHEFHTYVNWTTGPKEGQEVAYPELLGFTMLQDAGVFFFGVVVLLEAVLIGLFTLRSSRLNPLIYLGIFLAIACTLFNGYVILLVVGHNFLLPLISVFAVAFGGLIVVGLISLLRQAGQTEALGPGENRR